MDALLPDVCTIQYGFPFDSSKFSSSEGTPLIRIRDVVRGYSETYTSERYSEEYIVNDGDLLIGMDGEFNIAKWNGGKALLNQRVCRLFPKDNIDKGYLFYFMPQALKHIEEKTPFATVKHLSAKQLNSIIVPMPPLAEQQHIATVLDKVSNLIALRKQQLDKLDELIRSRFIELFDVDSFPRISFGDICCFLRNGANIKQSKGAGGYPITRIETLSNDVFNVDRLGYANITDLHRYKNYILCKGDILISHINSIAYLGRAVQYQGQVNTPIIHGMNLLRARLKGEYNPTYVEWYFKTPKAKDYISTITKKAVNQASITTTDLRLMQVPAPPLELQEQFAAFVEQTDKSRLTIQQGLDKLEMMKKALMQEYFG